MGRRPCCDKAKVKRGIWSPEEDATLKDYLLKHGPVSNWIALPQKAGLQRCGKSCRLRWLNYLRPDIKRGAFTQEEEDIICNLYCTIGSRWSIIALNLPGRTDNDVKNYWNTKLKKKYIITPVLPPVDKSADGFQVAADVSMTNSTFQGPEFGIALDSSPSGIFSLSAGMKEIDEEYNSCEVVKGIWSRGEVCGSDADLFSIFQVDCKLPQRMGQVKVNN